MFKNYKSGIRRLGVLINKRRRGYFLGWMGMMLLINGMAMGQQYQDSLWQSKHPLAISYCGITGATGTVTPEQIEAADSLVLMYNFGNKYQIDSFGIDIMWDDWSIKFKQNFIPKDKKLALANGCKSKKPLFYVNWIYVKNKETGETIHFPSKTMHIVSNK